MIAVVMVGVTLSCELAEFAADRTQGTSIQRGPLHTWSDVALGCLGAAVALAVDTRPTVLTWRDRRGTTALLRVIGTTPRLSDPRRLGVLGNPSIGQLHKRRDDVGLRR